jgi:hypothetical protein
VPFATVVLPWHLLSPATRPDARCAAPRGRCRDNKAPRRKRPGALRLSAFAADCAGSSGANSGSLVADAVVYPSHMGFRSRRTPPAPDRCVTPPRHSATMTRRRALRSGTGNVPRFPENPCATGIDPRCLGMVLAQYVQVDRMSSFGRHRRRVCSNRAHHPPHIIGANPDRPGREALALTGKIRPISPRLRTISRLGRLGLRSILARKQR